jgi:hypothetical protein
MKVKNFLFFILLHFQCLRGSQIEQDDIIEMIVSYKHNWIGYKDILKVWDFVNSFIGIENEQKPLPKEFRGRKYLLLYYNDKIDMLKGYLSLQYETELLKEVYDLLEEHFKILLREESLRKAVENLSAHEIYGKAIAKYQDYNLNPEDTITINKVINSLAMWQEKIKSEPSSDILKIIYKYNHDVISFPPSENFFYYCSELKYAQMFVTFGLIEHEGKRILQAQLDARLDKFVTGGGLETVDYYQMIAAHTILRQNTKYYCLLDYIRKFFVNRAIKLASKKDLPFEERQVFIINFENSRLLYFKIHHNQSAPNSLKKQCQKLLNAFNTYNYDEDLFSIFHELCYEKHPEFFTGLKSLI